MEIVVSNVVVVVSQVPDIEPVTATGYPQSDFTILYPNTHLMFFVMAFCVEQKAIPGGSAELDE